MATIRTVVAFPVAGICRVRSRAAVMACWNMFIPDLVPDLPAGQEGALAHNVKRPLVYTSVAVKNWSAFQKLGVSGVTSPTMYHADVSLAEAMSLGSCAIADAGRADRVAHDALPDVVRQAAEGT